MKPAFVIFYLLFTTHISFAQRTREVQNQNHFWWSLNTNARISKKWSVLADFHIRRTDFLAKNNFFFVRVGAGYTVTDQFSLATGYGHMWLANRSGATELFSNENRLYQQGSYTNNITGKISINNRLRIEERWQQKVVNARPINGYRFTVRFRYQLSVTIPISRNKKIPSLALGDEVMLQTGKDIIYNTFDQNRLFVGIKQQLTPSLSFDFGYMQVWQQKLSGYQYSRNHTIRWYFYWKPDWRKKKKTTHTQLHSGNDI